MVNCSLVLLLFATITGLAARVSGEAMHIHEQNYETIRSTAPLLFLNFYAEWCRYSQALKPVFDKAAEQLHRDYPDQVILGRINCEESKVLCQANYHITKYPTMKLLRNGQPAKREFRGQRSVAAFTEYIKLQMEEAVREYKDDEQQQGVVGFFNSRESVLASMFSKVASSLRDDCNFFIKDGQIEDKIIHIDSEGTRNQYTGNMREFTELYVWAHQHCVPVVREITFANGEELTEEGLPFVVLFRHPDDHDSVRRYKEVIEQHLTNERAGVNFVFADGLKFAHPLSHLGKTKKDLPVIAIDSFRHMYLFPNFEDIRDPEKLRQFIHDLHSGKLHREFHHGPDPTQAAAAPDITTDDQGGKSVPPESTFKKLMPAKSRYTLLRDEL